MKAKKYPIRLLSVLEHIIVVSIAYLCIWFAKRFVEDENTRMTITVCVFTISLLILNLRNQTHLLDSRFKALEELLFYRFGSFILTNQFFIRCGHWAKEKEFLAQRFVREVLPSLLRKIRKAGHTNDLRVNIIVDSGTTLTPIFSHLMESDILTEERNLHVYTNNLSGIDELQRMDFVDKKEQREQKELVFHLLPGRPFRKYRATIGDETLGALETLKGQNNSVTIGVVTANWLLGGQGLDELALCARGPGHLEFKKKVVEMSDYVVVVSALGKILRLGATPHDLGKLNDWIASSADSTPYPDPLVLPAERKERCILLTSFRSESSKSPLKLSSERLKEIGESGGGKNYVIASECSEFDLAARNSDIENIEMPHEYIRPYAKTAYY